MTAMTGSNGTAAIGQFVMFCWTQEHIKYTIVFAATKHKEQRKVVLSWLKKSHSPSLRVGEKLRPLLRMSATKWCSTWDILDADRLGVNEWTVEWSKDVVRQTVPLWFHLIVLTRTVLLLSQQMFGIEVSQKKWKSLSDWRDEEE